MLFRSSPTSPLLASATSPSSLISPSTRSDRPTLLHNDSTVDTPPVILRQNSLSSPLSSETPVAPLRRNHAHQDNAAQSSLSRVSHEIPEELADQTMRKTDELNIRELVANEEFALPPIPAPRNTNRDLEEHMYEYVNETDHKS